jgi:hypothetical protein
MGSEVIITPDMTPEEIASLQNPGGVEDQGVSTNTDNSAGSGEHKPQQTPEPSVADNATSSMEGRVTAAMREATDAKNRAELLEQNNQFLTQRAAETAAEAKALRERADAAEAERTKLQRQIAQAQAPKLSQDEVNKLVEEHGDHGAKPFIEMKNQMLEMSHRHQLELENLKDSTSSLPKQIEAEFGKQQAGVKASAFNAALMDPETGVPSLGTLLKDQTFVSALQKDPWGKLQPFNAALASNDISAVATIKAIVEGVTGKSVSSGGADPGTSGAGKQSFTSGGPQSRDSLIMDWNSMLDRGEIVQAQAFAKQHKLMD